ncbi:IS1230 transposase, partial [Salmonella enterica subsp. enterica serovar Montevideo str. MB110209-0055]
NALGWPLPPANLTCMNHSSTTGEANRKISSLPSEREQEMSAEIARLKRQLAERDEELAILQNGRDIIFKLS